ncbi:sorting nexin-17-like isoform X1 [Acanthaster planci]|uniref:Sorting nexin-17 n=1 Tax=Acanthaster planci TaxID=133434 RepID=A0A8B7ZQQ3_ACAPL|nr:sorting nexin-17-like isoform X1 [Acanthaster planci]XP_022105766.1 sorting nexin-17-like isoform X1 [Acanthaster planci]
MHFSIPDTQDINEGNSNYTSYNLHVNGVFHCSLRFSQLHDFQEQVKKEFGTSFLGTHKFPPKKLLPLTPSQVEERRQKLEKYIQLVSQDQKIANSDLFNGFLLSAQKETRRETPMEAKLDVYLMNGHKITVNIMSTDQTDDVLEVVASEIGLKSDFVYYFALFLVMKDEDDERGTIVRRVQDFESPFISLKSAVGKNKIVLRKNYWDATYDDDLIQDSVGLQLLYVQVLSDIERGWVQASMDQIKRLETLKAKGSRKEYLQFARTLKDYGFIQFKPCVVDYPAPNTPAVISAGNRELVFRLRLEDGAIKEGTFKITRMRCWRITSVNQGDDAKVDPTHLELAFEYLIGRNKLQWITMTSDQAILISLCLQDMVDELLLKKRGGRIKKPQDRVKGPERQFKAKDGGVIVASSTSTPGQSDPTTPPQTSTDTSPSKTSKTKGSVKKISDKLQSVVVSPKQSTPKSVVENDIFDAGIGEDDL